MPPIDEDIAWLKSTFHPIPRLRLPDDCVEYELYIFDDGKDVESPTSSATTSTAKVPSGGKREVRGRQRLREVQKDAAELQKRWLRDYIWQRQGFGPLEVVNEDGVTFLRGRTEYGDSIEDEWVVVWLLRELTKKSGDLWVKVQDNDGEFLLVEASGTLPAWLEPEIAENRVWIHDGNLTIVKPQHDTRSSNKRMNEKLSLQEARGTILKEPKRLLHSASIEEEAFYRLRNYPEQIAENMHHALVTIPRKVAFLLRQKPAYVSAATEAFYLRDPIALKPLQVKNNTKLIFPPEDLVTVSIQFPRVGYAQLRSQDFPPPAMWAGKLPISTDEKERSRAEIGMKISCGFEMLLSDPQNQDKPAVREMTMLIADLAVGDEQLPTNEVIAQWDMREDSEDWLNISFEDLEGELAGRSNGKGGSKKGGDFGDKAAQENLQRMVAQFEQFLNDDKVGPDEAGLFDEDSEDDDLEDLEDEDDNMDEETGEDKEASFDEDEFTRMMREMMGMPPEVMREMMTGKIYGPKKATEPSKIAGRSRVEELDSDAEEEREGYDSYDTEEMQSIMQRMEVELNETGVLNLDPTPRKIPAAREAVKGKGKASATDTKDDNEESDGGEENDMDMNLAMNLLESLQGQGGVPGPGGNLMGMMGLNLDRAGEDRNTPS